jgi:hypothetical protein
MQGRVGGKGSIGLVGVARGEGVRGIPGSVSRFDCWVQVMYLWSITLGDE